MEPLQHNFIAKRYLDEHNVENLVADMITSLLLDRNENPKIFMIKYLAGQLTKEEMEKYKLVIPGPYPKSPDIIKKEKEKKNNAENKTNKQKEESQKNKEEKKIDNNAKDKSGDNDPVND